MIKKTGSKAVLSGLMAVLTLLATSLPVAAAPSRENIQVAYHDFRVNMQGQSLPMHDANGSNVQPFSYNGTIYLPLRAIAESLGLEASYDSESHVVILTGSITSEPLVSSGEQPNGEPPEPPSGEQPSGEQPSGEPPEPPSGEQPSGEQPSGEPPEPPSGEQPSGEPPEPPSGEPPEGSPTEKPSQSGDLTYEQIEVDYNDIIVELNGEPLELTDANGDTVNPFSYDGSIYLPVRAICQALGLTVAYDSGSCTVNLSGPGSEASQE